MNLEKLQVELTADAKQYKKEMKEAAKVAKETGKEVEKTTEKAKKKMYNPAKAVRASMDAIKKTANQSANPYTGKSLTELKKLEAKYKATYETARSEIEKTSQKLEELNSKINVRKNEIGSNRYMEEKYRPGTDANKWDYEKTSLTTSLDEQEAKLNKIETEYHQIAAALNQVSNAANTTTKSITKTNSTFDRMKNVASKIKGVQKNIKSLTIQSGKLGGILGRVKYMFQTMFVMRGIMMAMRYVVEGFQNLAQYSGSANTQISNLKSSLTQLKNTLAAAFLPILEAITPALQKLIGWLTKGIEAVGMFFAALQGKTTYTRAVYAQEDYAASLKNSADAANELKKATAGFDEINTLDSPKGAGAGGYQAPTAGMMFETVEIDDKMVKLGATITTIIGLFAALKIGMMAYNVIAGITAIATGAISWPVLAVIAAIVALIAIIAVVALNWDKIKEAGTKAWEKIKEGWQNFKDWFKDMFPGLSEAADKGWEVIKEHGKTIFSSFISSIKDLFKSVIEFICTPFETGIQAAKQLLEGDLLGAVKTVCKGIANYFIRGINVVINAINAVATPIRNLIVSIGKVSGKDWTIDSVRIPNIPTFATGGFPEDGLFMANHGELVGQFSNGKTAVANNQQILQGIQAGVFKAVDAALKQNGGKDGDGYTQIIVKLGNDTVYKAFEKGQKKYDRRMKPSTT